MMPVKRLYTPQVMEELHRRQQQGDTEEEIQAREEKALIVTWVRLNDTYRQCLISDAG